MDANEKRHLEEIAATLATAPRKGASTFRQALQIAYLAHIAIMMESLDISIGLGAWTSICILFTNRMWKAA